MKRIVEKLGFKKKISIHTLRHSIHGHRSPRGGLVGGGEMQLTAITDGSGRVLYNHPLPYLDSG